MRLIYSLHLLEEEYEQIQKHPMGNFTDNSTDWFCYEAELSGGDYYSIENPSKDLELFLSLKGLEYVLETESKGWMEHVRLAMENTKGDVCR